MATNSKPNFIGIARIWASGMSISNQPHRISTVRSNGRIKRINRSFGNSWNTSMTSTSKPSSKNGNSITTAIAHIRHWRVGRHSKSYEKSFSNSKKSLKLSVNQGSYCYINQGSYCYSLTTNVAVSLFQAVLLHSTRHV